MFNDNSFILIYLMILIVTSQAMAGHVLALTIILIREYRYIFLRVVLVCCSRLQLGLWCRSRSRNRTADTRIFNWCVKD